MVSRKTLLNLYKCSPVPVHEKNMRTWRQYAHRRIGVGLGSGKCTGVFYHLKPERSAKIHKSPDFIVIEKSRTNTDKVRTLFHEIGHFRYMKRYGWKSENSPIEEAFAERYALREMIKHRLYASANRSVECVIYWRDCGEKDIYAAAARRLLIDKQYRKMAKELKRNK